MKPSNNLETVKNRFNTKWLEEGKDWIIDGKNKGKCWIWIGAMGGGAGDYGRIRAFGKNRPAHRVSWMIYVGPIEDKLDVDHIVCKNHRCVNPQHLRIVTHRINSIENSISPIAMNYSKTHCPRGHELIAGNLVSNKLKNGARECRTCRNDFKSARNRL